mmetsp:Transcript_51707/g.136657  ORF Transcript_51707/g.136657 Transcript_51707/m.136657 type:complete len:251 (+) Transcript_51707:793-1545(+)
MEKPRSLVLWSSCTSAPAPSWTLRIVDPPGPTRRATRFCGTCIVDVNIPDSGTVRKALWCGCAAGPRVPAAACRNAATGKAGSCAICRASSSDTARIPVMMKLTSWNSRLVLAWTFSTETPNWLFVWSKTNFTPQTSWTAFRIALLPVVILGTNAWGICICCAGSSAPPGAGAFRGPTAFPDGSVMSHLLLFFGAADSCGFGFSSFAGLGDAEAEPELLLPVPLGLLFTPRLRLRPSRGRRSCLPPRPLR